MKNLSPEFCKQVKSARREAGMTQGELAGEVGCKQSALSMFEQGDGTKLNDEVIEKLAKKFNLEMRTADAEPAVKDEVRGFYHQVGEAVLPIKGFCPNPHCPSNHAYFVEERQLFRPNRVEADPVGGKYCALCGELLEKRCPSCGAPVHDGAICSLCGEPYVVSVG